MCKYADFSKEPRALCRANSEFGRGRAGGAGRRRTVQRRPGEANNGRSRVGFCDGLGVAQKCYYIHTDGKEPHLDGEMAFGLKNVAWSKNVDT